jgi:hypothetical protein
MALKRREAPEQPVIVLYGELQLVSRALVAADCEAAALEALLAAATGFGDGGCRRLGFILAAGDPKRRGDEQIKANSRRR